MIDANDVKTVPFDGQHRMDLSSRIHAIGGRAAQDIIHWIDLKNRPGLASQQTAGLCRESASQMRLNSGPKDAWHSQWHAAIIETS